MARPSSVVRDGPDVSVGRGNDDSTVASRRAGDFPPVHLPKLEFQQYLVAVRAVVDAVAEGGFVEDLGACGEDIKDL
jgi:hypothetical protein